MAFKKPPSKMREVLRQLGFKGFGYVLFSAKIGEGLILL